jgi:hypothetical protein
VRGDFYAVQFRITNIGSGAYPTWPSNAQIVDSKGRSYEIGTGVPSCQSFSEQTIAPGSSALGCFAREIPKHATIARVRFTLYPGDTGQWKVG